MSAKCQKPTRALLFDHFVGGAYQPVWNGHTQCLGCFEVDHKLELGGLHDRKIGRLLALEYSPDIDAGFAPGVVLAVTVAHQAPICRELTQFVDRGHPMADRQCCELSAFGIEKVVP